MHFMPTSLSFKPKQVTKKLLSPLSGRAKDVVANRFGITDSAERKTLESIGKQYGITRERVRQIEQFALTTIKKSEIFGEFTHVFQELKGVMNKLGGLVAEHEILEQISKDTDIQNHVHFYLTLGDDFKRHKENDDLHHRWTTNTKVTETVHTALAALYNKLDDQELMSEDSVIAMFTEELKDLAVEYRQKEILHRYLRISKSIGKNALNEWGKTTSQHIHTRGIKDFAYLVIRKFGKPMHFKEVARDIAKYFNKKAHIATTHNELIKDKRFVLVGRGVYGLKEWGHVGGVVRDVIVEVMKESNKPMTKEDIIEKVITKRVVKPNTVLVNLQNEEFFKKTKDGLYTLV